MDNIKDIAKDMDALRLKLNPVFSKQKQIMGRGERNHMKKENNFWI